MYHCSRVLDTGTYNPSFLNFSYSVTAILWCPIRMLYDGVYNVVDSRLEPHLAEHSIRKHHGSYLSPTHYLIPLKALQPELVLPQQKCHLCSSRVPKIVRHLT